MVSKLELVNKSYLGIGGYISSDTSLDDLEQYIKTNKHIFDKFKGIIVASNYAYNVFIERHHNLWQQYFDNVKFIDLDVNRGHTIGTLDLDGAIFDYCKENDIDWLFKIYSDMLYFDEFLEGEVPEADFYYWQGIGHGGMEKYDYDNDRMIKEDFYPQTTQYFINTSKLDELHSKQAVDGAYNYIQSLENYSGRIWEHIEGFTCEDLLKNAVIKNNLTKHHMIKPDTYIRLLDFVKGNNIHDCSHKQLILDGTLHYQFIGQQCIKI